MIRKAAKGFTLIEVALAITIIVMIVGTVYAFYWFSLRMRDGGERYLRRAQVARAVLLTMADEIRSATVTAKSFGPVMTGTRESLSMFVTVVPPNRALYYKTSITDSSRPVVHDLQRVTYNIAYDPEDEEKAVGLTRSALKLLLANVVEQLKDEDLTEEAIRERIEEETKFDVDLGLSEKPPESPEQQILEQEMLSGEIRYLAFEYYDGRQWLDAWQPSEGDLLPQAVRITVGFEQISEEQIEEEQAMELEERPWHRDRFSLTVKLLGVDDYRTMLAQEAQRLKEETGFGESEFEGFEL